MSFTTYSECPTKPIITPAGGVVANGTVFTCTSTSDPAANYTWFDASGNVGYGNTISVDTAGPYQLMCKAKMNIGGIERCSTNTTIIGEAYGMYRTFAIILFECTI